MKILSYLDNAIANALLIAQQDSKRSLDLSRSLSGSILGAPLQEQILHIIGVPKKQIDPYVLRKFERGHHVEAWVMDNMLGLLNTEQIIAYAKSRGAVVGVDEEGQAMINYRIAKGHVDAIVDMKAWDMPEIGIIPHEVKSITNANWNRLFGGKMYKEPDAKWSHKLQAGMYAKALFAGHFVIHYVASDDYRIMSLLYKTDEISSDIDQIITEVEEQLVLGQVPIFTPREAWQGGVTGKQYANYPAWMDLDHEQLQEKLKKEYPEAYERLLSFGKEGGE
jgi:hypothetical protein